MPTESTCFQDCVTANTNHSPTSTLPKPVGWPELDDAALHGLAGDFVRLISPHSESPLIGLLLQFLVFFGNVIGRGPHFKVEADYHPCNLFTALVGQTAKGRKGTSYGYVRKIFATVEPDWAAQRIQSGLSSGEGLIWAVRDPIPGTNDVGVSDKNLLVFEPEFAKVLKVLRRDTNTLGPGLRQAWDSGDLRILTKNSPATATGAHISLISHITLDELIRLYDPTDAANGLYNRFLWACVMRSKLLPEGGNLDPAQLDLLTERVRQAVHFAQRVGELKRDEAARELWIQVYPVLSEGTPGLVGGVISRSESQVMRLATIYALLDMSSEIRFEHLKAALALWQYCEDSAEYIFGDPTNNLVADKIIEGLRSAQELDDTAISNLFNRRKSATQLNEAKERLRQQDLIHFIIVGDTGGRNRHVWRLGPDPTTTNTQP